jgi:hypothetical protein
MSKDNLITFEASYRELNEFLQKTFELMSFSDLIRYGAPNGYNKIAPRLIEYCKNNKAEYYNDDFRNFYATKTLEIENKFKKRKYNNFRDKPKDSFQVKIIFENPFNIKIKSYTNNNFLKQVLQKNESIFNNYLNNKFDSTFTVLNYNSGIALHIKKGDSIVGYIDRMIKNASIFIIPTNVNCMNDFLDFLASVLDYGYLGDTYDKIIYPTEVFGSSLLNFESIVNDFKIKFSKNFNVPIFNKYHWKSYYLHHQTKEYNIVEIVNGLDKNYLDQKVINKNYCYDDDDNDFREDYRRSNNDAYEVDSNEYDGWYDPID